MDGVSSSLVSLGLAALERDYGKLISHFARLLRNRTLAEDLVNDAIAESLTKLHAQQVEEPAKIAAYVYGVAINLLRNHRRRLCNRADAHADASALETLAAADDPADHHDQRNVEMQLREVIERLPISRDRELVRRFYLDEEEKTAICADLKLTPSNFSRVIFRARRRIKTLLTECCLE